MLNKTITIAGLKLPITPIIIFTLVLLAIAGLTEREIRIKEAELEASTAQTCIAKSGTWLGPQQICLIKEVR